MKKNWPQEVRAIVMVLVTAVMVLLAYAGMGAWTSRGRLSVYLRSLPDHSMLTARLAGQDLRLEVVNTQASIGQGLSDRQEIGSDGMLFALPARGTYPFWMPRMYFDLDIVWLDDGKVVDISPRVPAQPGVPLTNLPLYTSEKPVNMVLEIAAGRVEAWNVRVGDELEITRH